VRRRTCRQRQERGDRRALELARAHLAAQAAVDGSAGNTGAEVCFGQARLSLARSAARLRADRAGAELAHPPGCGDRRDAVELRRGAARRRPRLAERHLEQPGSGDGADAVARHRGEHGALALVELGDQIGRAREALALLERVDRAHAGRRLLQREVELDAPARAQARQVAPFAVAPAAVGDGQPEGAEQVALVGDRAR
jgi:hypothetical protein